MGLVAEKFTRTNYVLWRAQVTPQLRGAGYFGYVDGTMPEPAQFIITKDKDGKEEKTLNPLYPIWFREGQHVSEGNAVGGCLLLPDEFPCR